MSSIKEIQQLHKRGFVILRAQRVNNSPIGWKRKDGSWGYVDEMSDTTLSRYNSTFNAEAVSKSHCGFYLGHNHLCCIDLDTKKTDHAETAAVVKKIIGLALPVCIETTKSNGYHIYFQYETDLPNMPDFMQKQKDNWIEVYFRKRFIACYLSNSKKYAKIYGSIEGLKLLTKKQFDSLMKVIEPYKGKEKPKKKSRPVKIDADTLNRVKAYVDQIEEQRLDITGDNPKWFRIGKAIASAFGEEGFTLFNRLSRFSPKYNEDSIQDDYQAFVDGDKRERGQKITIATFFHICEEAGLISPEAVQAKKLHPAKIEKEFKIVFTKKESMAEHVHLLVHHFKEVVPICCTDKANFYVFEHTHWKQKNSREVIDLIKEFINRCDIDPEFLLRLFTVPYLDMAIREIQMTTLRSSMEPNTGNLTDGVFINMENGILHINLKNGKRTLLDHSPEYNFTTMLPYEYDPTATCPKFDAWMQKQIPDKDLHEVYYAFTASCLTKHKADIIMLLAGETSTGKSSLIDITRRLIGLENSVAVSAGTLFSGKPDAATVAMQMENKLLAYDFDAQPFKHLEMLLKVAAQEPIQGWQMHVARRSVTNYGRLIVAMNPYNYSVFNPAVARRFITINMDVKVEKDNSVMPAIYEKELAGIFNHVVNIGLKHLIQNNGQIKQTERMRRATLDFHTNERDSIKWFNSLYEVPKQSTDTSKRKTAEQKLREANDGKLPVLVSSAELYREFKIWMEDEEGYHPSRIPLRKHFASDLKLIGAAETVYKVDGKAVRGVYVIRK